MRREGSVLCTTPNHRHDDHDHDHADDHDLADDDDHDDNLVYP